MIPDTPIPVPLSHNDRLVLRQACLCLMKERGGSILKADIELYAMAQGLELRLHRAPIQQEEQSNHELHHVS